MYTGSVHSDDRGECVTALLVGPHISSSRNGCHRLRLIHQMALGFDWFINYHSRLSNKGKSREALKCIVGSEVSAGVGRQTLQEFGGARQTMDLEERRRAVLSRTTLHFIIYSLNLQFIT